MFSFPLVNSSCPSKSALIHNTRSFIAARLLRDVDTLLSLSSSLVRERASFLLHPTASSASYKDQDDLLDEAFQWSSKHPTGRRLRDLAQKNAVQCGWEQCDWAELEKNQLTENLALAMARVLLPDEERGPGDNVSAPNVVFAQRDKETLLAATWVPGADDIVVISLWEKKAPQETERKDVPLLHTLFDPANCTNLDWRWSYHDATTVSGGQEGWNDFVKEGAWLPGQLEAEQAFADRTANVPQTPPEETQADADDYWNRYGLVEENETSPSSVRAIWSPIRDRAAYLDQESNYWDRYTGVTGVLDDDGEEQGKRSVTGQGELRGIDDPTATPVDHQTALYSFDSPMRPDMNGTDSANVPRSNNESPVEATDTSSFSHISPLDGSEISLDDWPSPKRIERKTPFLSTGNAFSSSSVPSASARAREIEERREFVMASLRSTLGLARAIGFTNAELMSMIDEATK